MPVSTPVANPAGIVAVQDILKEVWVSDTLESQLYEDTILLDWIENVTEYTDSDGLKATVPLRTGRTGGVSARGIGQQLGAASHQAAGKATYNYKNLYLQVQVYGPVVAKMETQRQSAVREIDFEVKNGIEDFRRDMCRQLQRAGAGILTVANLPGSAAGLTIDLGAANYPIIDRGWIYVDQLIDIGDATTPTAAAGAYRVASVVDSTSAPQITITSDSTAGNVTALATHQISLAGNRSAGGVSNEMTGIEGIVDDVSALGGLTPASAPYWKAIKDFNAGTPRALSIPLMNNVWRKIKQRGGRTEVLLSDLVQQQKYYELLQPQVRFAGDTRLGAGNVEGPNFNNVQVIGDPDCLPNRIYFLNKGSIQLYSGGKIAWQNQTTGGDVLAWRQDYDAFVGRAAKYGQVGTNRRASNGVLGDLS
jgi:hypothetical protein